MNLAFAIGLQHHVVGQYGAQRADVPAARCREKN